MAKAYSFRREEVEAMLGFLVQQADETQRFSVWCNPGDNSAELTAFMTFRDKISEFESFSIIIEERIRALVGEQGITDLREQLDQLIALIFGRSLEMSIRFFDKISLKQLPLGSHEIFSRELRTLYRCNERLQQTSVHGRLSKNMLRDVSKAEKILTLIIERAPRLLDFDDKRVMQHDDA
ncbi:MAG: hypothetical protein HQL37_02320 [Alphaproteobacteria bacterium]|nr:hypothetical protein [Alphaproteobacteria bacterium]